MKNKKKSFLKTLLSVLVLAALMTASWSGIELKSFAAECNAGKTNGVDVLQAELLEYTNIIILMVTLLKNYY